jgi:thiol-disulfide isomerase/thioredoxin
MRSAGRLASRTASVSGKLTLFVAKGCPHCPVLARDLRGLAAANPGIELAVIDVAEDVAAARAAEVVAVPTLVIQDRVRLTGAANVDDLVQLLVDPTALTRQSLRRFIDQGNAQALAELMNAETAIIPALFELLTEPTFSVRLGAMTVTEKLCELNRSLAATIADPLWAHFRGDILYLLGEVGARHLLPDIEAIATGEFTEDVKEAAREAAEALEKGGRR